MGFIWDNRQGHSIVWVCKHFNVITMVHTKYIKQGVYNFLSFRKLVQQIFPNSPLICVGVTIYGWEVVCNLFGKVGKTIQHFGSISTSM